MSEQSAAGLPKLSIQAKVIGCFSQTEIMVDIILASNHSTQMLLTMDGTPAYVEHKTHDEAVQFITQVFTAASRPEVLTGGRITIRYEAKLKWENYFAEGFGSNGDLEFAGSDLTQEEVEMVLPGLTGERATHLKDLLRTGLHCRPIAIFLIAREFCQRVTQTGETT